MDIIAFLHILRRHWRVIVAAAVIGGVLGSASTVLADTKDEAAAKQRRYYKAIHTLLIDDSASGSEFARAFQSLDQLGLIATTGEVPDEVAKQRGTDANELVTHVLVVTKGSTNTLDIVTAYRDREEAEAVADAFAEQLKKTIGELQLARYSSARDDAIKRVQQQKERVAQLDAQVAAPPPGSSIELLRAERDSAVNAYRVAFERFQQIASEGEPTASSLTTLGSAEALPIGESEYNARILRGQLGDNILAQGTPVDPNASLVGSSSSSSSFSGPVSRGILGALLGLVAGIGLAVALDRMDRRLRTREATEEAFGIPVLAEIPELDTAQRAEQHVVARDQPMSAFAEAYRSVRSSLLFQHTGGGNGDGSSQCLVVLVTSPNPREGKTTTTANLAVLFAETGARVLAINCDFRRPALHQYLGVPNEPRRVFTTEVNGVSVVTNVSDPGGPNPFSIVDEQRRLVAHARGRFDVILLDTAPMLTTNDAMDLIDVADEVLLVARIGSTTTDAGRRCHELLSRVQAPAVGVALLGTEPPATGYYHYLYRGGRGQPGKPPGPANGANGASGQSTSTPAPTGRQRRVSST